MASEILKAEIRKREGLALQSYLCPAGFWTLGYGHTAGIGPGMSCTLAQAEEWLDADIAREELALAKVISRPLTQNQRDAILDLAFNLKGGARALPLRAPKLTQAINEGRWQDAARQFLDINKGGGKVLPGLTKRREWESSLFLSLSPGETDTI